MIYRICSTSIPAISSNNKLKIEHDHYYLFYMAAAWTFTLSKGQVTKKLNTMTGTAAWQFRPSSVNLTDSLDIIKQNSYLEIYFFQETSNKEA